MSGKRVVICGASRGIGLAMAQTFARCGAAVAISARGREGLALAERNLLDLGGRVVATCCDLSQRSEAVRFVEDAAGQLGGIDILVNNASGFGSTNDEAGWQASIEVDLRATYCASFAAEPHLAERGGAILNVASISGFRASRRAAPYAAVKAAIINYTMSQAVHLASKSIRVNAIAPGSIEFPGGHWAQQRDLQSPLYDSIKHSIPFGRLGTPDEVARVAVFLCSDLAGWITGQTIVVDGGQMLT